MPNQTVIIGTRGSKLALWQAHYTQQLLLENNIPSEIKIIQTQGDASQTWNTSFDKLEGKGFFTKELEEALLAAEIDMAVHSCKDLPTQYPEGLTIAGYSARANPFDVLLINKQNVDRTKPLALKANAIVGTSSSRRKAQLLSYRSDLFIKDIRGNVPTRMDKLKNNDFDAIVLAQAGIDRLKINIDDFYVFPLVAPMFVPAAAQGILAYQIRTDDQKMLAICAQLNHALDAEIVNIERKILHAFDGGCQIPLGIFAKKEEQKMHIWISYATHWNAIPARIHFTYNHINDVDVQQVVRQTKEHQPKSVFISRNKLEDDYFVRTLEFHGYSVHAQSLLKFVSKPFDVAKVKHADWIFFSSKQAIDFFIQKIDIKLVANKKLAVLGLGTATHLQQYNLQPDFVGDGLGKTTAKLFENTISSSTKVLFPCATQTLYMVQHNFSENRIEVENIEVYENSIIDTIPQINSAILVFTSPLNARGYFSKYKLKEKQKVVAIGNTTSEKLTQLNIEHQVAYAPYNYCLVDEVMRIEL